MHDGDFYKAQLPEVCVRPWYDDNMYELNTNLMRSHIRSLVA